MNKIILALGMLTISSAHANLNIRLAQSFSTSSALWSGENKLDYSGASLFGNEKVATRHYYQTKLDVRKDFKNNFYLQSGFIYSYSKTLDAPILQTVEGESHSQLTKMTVSGGYRFNFARHQFTTFLGYEHPGQMSIKQPVFLSPHDYSTNFLIGGTYTHYFSKWIASLYVVNRHVIKGTQPNQILFQTQSVYRYNSKFSFGAGIDLFHAFGGIDINSQRFSDFTTRRGVIPVWRKKERFWGASLISIYQFSNLISYDFYLHKKLTGRNTDDGTTLGAAATWNF